MTGNGFQGSEKSIKRLEIELKAQIRLLNY